MNDFGNFVDRYWKQSEDLSYITQRVSSQFDQIFLELSHQPENVLFLGYHNAVKQSYISRGITVNTVIDHDQKYDTVIALDEYFTYSSSENSQRQNIATVLDCLEPKSTRGYQFCNH